MRVMKPAIAIDPALFGRKELLARPEPAEATSFADDLRLFAMTFAAGFLFVAVLIA